MEQDIWREVHPAYRNGLQSAFEGMAHQGELSQKKDSLLLEASLDGVRLMVSIDPLNHLVLKAVHIGGTSPVVQGLMDSLCEILENVSVQEASDHACIYLEDRLRDYSQKPPVAGVITPENADPIFQLPLKLTRKLLEKYINETGYSDPTNFFVRPPSDAWKALPVDEKIRRIKEVFSTVSSGEGFDAALFEIVEITENVRITVRCMEGQESLKIQEALMKFENAAKKELDGAVQLSLEEVKDINVIRRL